MRYVPRNCVGFEMTDRLAESLGVSEAWENWNGWEDDDDILGPIEENLSVYPARIAKLIDEKGGERSGLQGFESGRTYLLFEVADTRNPWWKGFSDKCEEAGSPETEGSWSQLM